MSSVSPRPPAGSITPAPPGRRASTVWNGSSQRQRRKVTTMNADPRRTWALDREIVLSRVIAAPRERVFQAWADPKPSGQWFGPGGFKVDSLECDVRAVGRGRFVFTGPDGTRYDNRMVFLRVEAPRLIEIEHGSDNDEDHARLHVTVMFD